MARLVKRYLSLVLVAALAGTLPPASAQMSYQGSADSIDQEQIRREPTGAEMAADAVFARPLGLVGTVAGSVLWVLSLPFTLPSGSAERAAKQMVAKPAEFTFKRPLGQFSSCEALPESCGRSR
jgi:hypothetical protein